MATLYVRTTMTIPGVGTAVHIAELEEQSLQMCQMNRLIAMDGDGVIMGVAEDGKTRGNIDMPTQQVPHPDTYHQYKDISTEHMEPAEFEGLWGEATAKFR